jgi:fatty-acyl-CoA synthase
VLSPETHRIAVVSDEPAVRARLGSVGIASPAIELEIRDPSGAPCAPRVHGEIWVRGEQVSGEYVGRGAALNEGWYATNDAGWLDEEGYLFVEGRLDDVIVRGGENIAPAEIEEVLRAHPAVADVAVVGTPDEEWGEQIVAFVVAHEAAPPAAELQDLVRGRLRSTRVPARVIFRQELPYNETGKLLRRVLRGSVGVG